MTTTTPNLMPRCYIRDLGFMDYLMAWKEQENCVRAVFTGEAHQLLICEHPVVLTLGRMARKDSICLPHEEIRHLGIPIISVDRGGDVTLHSPGQLVVYPIFNLHQLGPDLKRMIFNLEQLTIDLLKDFDILANRILGRTGVWVGKEKIASIGIGVKKWITYHGLSINVNTDLSLYHLIKPCGMDVPMTSMHHILKKFIDQSMVKERIIHHTLSVFGLSAL